MENGGNETSGKAVQITADMLLSNTEYGLVIGADFRTGDLEDQPKIVAGLALTHLMKLAQRELEYIITSGITEDEIAILTSYAMTPLPPEEPEDQQGYLHEIKSPDEND